MYAGTVTTTKKQGARLTAPKAAFRDVALIATRCNGCGTVGVYLGNTLLKKISLQSATTRRQSLITVADWAVARTGALSVRVISRGKPVHIDGLATAR